MAEAQAVPVVEYFGCHPRGALRLAPTTAWVFAPAHPRPLSSAMPNAQRIRVKLALLHSVSRAAQRIIAAPRMSGKQPLLIFQPLNSSFGENVSDLCGGSPLAPAPERPV